MITEKEIIRGEVEVEAEAWTGVIVIGVGGIKEGKETTAGEAGASVRGGLVLITPRGGEEDAMMMSVEAEAVAGVVAGVIPWIGLWSYYNFYPLGKKWEFDF